MPTVDLLSLAAYDYDLPPHLIARHPSSERSASRLLHLERATGRVTDRVFRDLPGLLAPGDLLVVNETRVLPARLRGRKTTGGRVEILLERFLDHHRFLAQAGAGKPPRSGTRIVVGGPDDSTGSGVGGGRGRAGRPGEIECLGRDGDFFVFQAAEPAAVLFERWGEVPLPPYLGRLPQAADRERYQTVYARHAGSVAAPTAGLHFDAALLDALAARGIERTALTLHVGAGTFQPVRVDDLRRHRMHGEWFEVSGETVAAIERARARGGRVIAAGTTTARALESAAAGPLRACSGMTDLFIYPGYRWRVIDALLTNFHLPRSTLLMLVCAFGGYREVLDAYRRAIDREYRFYSYGDAMLIS